MSKKQFSALSLTCFSQGLGFSMIATFLGIYADLFHLTGFQIGVVTMAYSLTQFALLFPVAKSADRGKRKLLLLVGLLFGIPVYGAFWLADGFWSLTTARFLQALTYPMTALTALSFISLRSPAVNRGRNIGYYNMLKTAGRTIGAVVGGLLVGRYGFGASYSTLMVLYGLGFIAVYFLVPPEEHESERANPGNGLNLRDLLESDRFKIQISFETAFSFAKAIIVVFIPVYAYAVLGLSEAQLGIVVASRYLPMVLGQGITGKISDKIGRGPLIICGGLISILALLVLPSQTTFESLIMIAFLVGIADTIRVPASWAVFADEGVEKGAATSLSLRMLAWRPGMIAGPILGGLVQDYFGIQWTFYLAALAVAVSLVAYTGLSTRLSPRKN